MYGRGAIDDGYALFASILIVKTCQELGLPQPRVVITIEADEETESRDLPHYYDKLKDRIGDVSVVVIIISKKN